MLGWSLSPSKSPIGPILVWEEHIYLNIYSASLVDLETGKTYKSAQLDCTINLDVNSCLG
jgi:hypothetical protein